MIGALLAVGLVAQPCVVRSGGPGAGTVLAPEAALESEAPVELAIVGHGTAVSGTRAEVRCAADALEVHRGRLWVGADRPLTIRVEGHTIAVSAGSWVVVGVEVGAPPTVAVAAGRAEVPDVGRVEAGQIWSGGEVRRGGSGWFETVGPGAARWGWTGRQARAELLRRLTALEARRPGPPAAPSRSSREMAGDPEIFGADGGPAGRLLEAGLRPDPSALSANGSD